MSQEDRHLSWFLGNQDPLAYLFGALTGLSGQLGGNLGANIGLTGGVTGTAGTTGTTGVVGTTGTTGTTGATGTVGLTGNLGAGLTGGLSGATGLATGVAGTGAATGGAAVGGAGVVRSLDVPADPYHLFNALQSLGLHVPVQNVEAPVPAEEEQQQAEVAEKVRCFLADAVANGGLVNSPLQILLHKDRINSSRLTILIIDALTCKTRCLMLNLKLF